MPLRDCCAMRSLAALALIATLLPLAAHGATYRCTDHKGRTTLQDFPCQTSSSGDQGAGSPGSGRSSAAAQPPPNTVTGSPSSNAGDYLSTRGAWRGPAQFHVVAGGQRDLQAHRIAPLVIELAPDGKVTGVVSEAGCKISGLTTQFVTPRVASIDVTMTGCTDTRFNTRMSGTLTANNSARETKLHLTNFGYTRSRQMQRLTLDAVLRR
jgi:Domain of unknown function (DUF4124)